MSKHVVIDRQRFHSVLELGDLHPGAEKMWFLITLATFTNGERLRSQMKVFLSVNIPFTPPMLTLA